MVGGEWIRTAGEGRQTATSSIVARQRDAIFALVDTLGHVTQSIGAAKRQVVV